MDVYVWPRIAEMKGFTLSYRSKPCQCHFNLSIYRTCGSIIKRNLKMSEHFLYKWITSINFVFCRLYYISMNSLQYPFKGWNNPVAIIWFLNYSPFSIKISSFTGILSRDRDANFIIKMNRNGYHWDSSNTELYTTFYWIYMFNVPFYMKQLIEHISNFHLFIRDTVVGWFTSCIATIFLRCILFRCTHVNSAWPSDLSLLYNQFSVFLFNFLNKTTRIVLFENKN